jgi:lipopolysaccharide transport system ATP-binding protein
MASVITVENLSKKYIIGHQKQERYTALRDVLANGAKQLTRKLCHPFSPPAIDSAHEEFWALKDVSFDIKQGDRVGIIGRNGAGKSTLLKILSRITEPTSGRISIKGRVASLLEVGTGFHPELTGRENIFLNGAILGMSKAEIKKKFDEIVAFAEVERFLDTPVKHYSSGMYVRLAFAVAAHLEPEILIVDEVLAVGDAKFQKKCMGKMESVGIEGRTVLFVSHQMAAIQRLCNSVIMLSAGQTKFIGETKVAIDYYLGNLAGENSDGDISALSRSGTGAVILDSFTIENDLGENLIAAASGEPLTLVFGYKSASQLPYRNVSLGFSLHNMAGDTLVVFYSDYMGVSFDVCNAEGRIKCRIEKWPFSVGSYYVGVRVLVNGIESDWPKGFVGVISVEAGDFYKQGNFGNSGTGPLLLSGDWSVQ